MLGVHRGRSLAVISKWISKYGGPPTLTRVQCAERGIGLIATDPEGNHIFGFYSKDAVAVELVYSSIMDLAEAITQVPPYDAAYPSDAIDDVIAQKKLDDRVAVPSIDISNENVDIRNVVTKNGARAVLAYTEVSQAGEKPLEFPLIQFELEEGVTLELKREPQGE